MHLIVAFFSTGRDAVSRRQWIEADLITLRVMPRSVCSVMVAWPLGTHLAQCPQYLDGLID